MDRNCFNRLLYLAIDNNTDNAAAIQQTGWMQYTDGEKMENNDENIVIGNGLIYIANTYRATGLHGHMAYMSISINYTLHDRKLNR
eukprot:UN17945